MPANPSCKRRFKVGLDVTGMTFTADNEEQETQYEVAPGFVRWLTKWMDYDLGFPVEDGRCSCISQSEGEIRKH